MAEQSTEACEALSREADRLSGLIARFRIARGAPARPAVEGRARAA
jgi:hypothetical protein